jgi:lysyl-tRNA synthetase class 2
VTLPLCAFTITENAAVSAPPDNFEASRIEKLNAIAALGIDPWGHRFDGHQPIADVLKLPTDVPDDQRPRVRIAGRIVSRREGGKVHFLDLKDWSGVPTLREIKGERDAPVEKVPDLTSRIQVMVGQQQVGETGWKLAQLFDLGDLVGVEGTFGKTRRGENTVFADGLTFLGKSMLPHPDKWGGMQDMEFRLRHRYLDLVYNPHALDRARKRVLIVRTIRRYLDEQGFCEVETPTLHAIASGAAARPFITHHNALDVDYYLRIALELHLKRLLVGGMERVYEIGRVFRNEGIDARHNPEFTMLELYQAYGDYRSMMDLVEGMVVACVRAIGSEMKLAYGEQTVDYTPPWPRLLYADLFAKHVGVSMADAEGVRKIAAEHGIATAGKHPDVLVHELFERKVEPVLAAEAQPVFVHDYPAALCPLTKRKRDNPAVAERFELYVRGTELANAYTELTDPVLQEATFRTQLAGLKEEDSMAKMDDDFVRALKHGMPPAGGIGVGIDRLVMFLTDTTTIRDVILFPLLRPEKK